MIIDDELREEAAVYCKAMALWWKAEDLNAIHPADVETRTLVRELARVAMMRNYSIEGIVKAWSDAEAMLRTGWTP